MYKELGGTEEHNIAKIISDPTTLHELRDAISNYEQQMFEFFTLKKCPVEYIQKFREGSAQALFPDFNEV